MTSINEQLTKKLISNHLELGERQSSRMAPMESGHLSLRVHAHVETELFEKHERQNRLRCQTYESRDVALQ